MEHSNNGNRPNITGHWYNSTIIREFSGIPHIRASSELVGYFNLGYIHAQDRLWQIEKLRRAAWGRLSEIFGKRILPFDKIMRNYGFEEISKNEIDSSDSRGNAN